MNMALLRWLGITYTFGVLFFGHSGGRIMNWEMEVEMI